MNPALQNARAVVAFGRVSRINAIADQLQAEDDRQEFSVTYTGYRNGNHWGRLPNGGEVPLQLETTGAIEVGAVVSAVAGAGGKLFVSAMPT